MSEFQIDCTSLANKAVLYQLKKEDPMLAALLEVFDEHNIWAPEAFAIMNEIYAVMKSDSFDEAPQIHENISEDKSSLKNNKESKLNEKNNECE